MVIGKQKMEGRWVKLKKPIAVMANEEAADRSTREYRAAGVVRHKLVFDSRPNPIVTRPASLAGPSKRARAVPELGPAAVPPC